MGDTTKIEWAHSTLNFWYGCTQLSPACDHCYAMRTVHRLNLGVVWNAAPVKALKDRIAQLRVLNAGGKRFLAGHGERRRIFINSMSDFFDKLAPQEWRDDAFEAFDDCTDVDILLVTKRPQNVLKMIPLHWRKGGWPPHVWLIVTAENKVEAERRGKVVREIRERTKVRTVGASVEPMLEKMGGEYLMWADWWIIGGESGGPKARHMDLDWPRRLRARARLEGKRFFFKQTTNKGPIPADLMVREFPL
jgi:protein gp37